MIIKMLNIVNIWTQFMWILEKGNNNILSWFKGKDKEKVCLLTLFKVCCEFSKKVILSSNYQGFLITLVCVSQKYICCLESDINKDINCLHEALNTKDFYRLLYNGVFKSFKKIKEEIQRHKPEKDIHKKG